MTYTMDKVASAYKAAMEKDAILEGGLAAFKANQAAKAAVKGVKAVAATGTPVRALSSAGMGVGQGAAKGTFGTALPVRA